MSAASLSAADFASPVGYLGTSESTPYYPTGDLQDRNIAFTNAMDCVDHLEDYLHGNDDVRIATKLVELAQALSDLGLHEYALNTSGFALDTLERLFTAAPDDSRLHLASILSLRANILCDLKRNDEARDMADRAVSLCKEHRDSQTAPVSELAYALLNYAVLLNSIGHKDESAAVAFELLSDEDEAQPDMKDVFALCNLCLSNTRTGTDDDTALSMAEEAIELTRTSSDASSQTVLAGALLDKSRILSSRGQNDAAVSLSAEAVTLLRSMSATRPVFSLFLAHALDVHAHTLSEAGRKAESYTIVQNAVELWQTLKISAPGPIARPLAWALFRLAKFRHKGGERNALIEELRIAESAVNVFREVVPLDAPGLADALYLYADRMLELDKNREAATYAEESVQYFREALEKDQKYAPDLIFSLSLASSCLACTERAGDAFEYAKQAVEVQHGRKNAEDPLYGPHLRQLLMDVIYRATENDKADEASPWFHELQSLDPSGGMHGFFFLSISKLGSLANGL
jgi:tetratricopeptide (TPR) repeat protein